MMLIATPFALLTAPARMAVADPACMKYDTLQTGATKQYGADPIMYEKYIPGMSLALGIAYDSCAGELQIHWRHSVCIEGCPDRFWRFAYKTTSDSSWIYFNNSGNVRDGAIFDDQVRLTNVAANTAYSVAVQDCRPSRCSVWSATVTIRT
jgi:hypothetical protein